MVLCGLETGGQVGKEPAMAMTPHRPVSTAVGKDGTAQGQLCGEGLWRHLSWRM